MHGRAPAAVTRRRANDPCWCGSGRKLKRCHGAHEQFRRAPVRAGAVSAPLSVPDHVVRPGYVAAGVPPTRPGVQRHSGDELERLRHACHVAAEVLAKVGAHVAPGVTTEELDRIAHEAYVRRGAYPSDLGYNGFPKSVCTSVNDVVCHGIPDDRPLVDGDIVNVDVTGYIDGMHGDTSATFLVGDVDAPTAALVEVTREAMLAGIAEIAPGRDLMVVAAAIQAIAYDHGFGVVRDWGGHGIGAIFHAEPHVYHTLERVRPFVLEPGITFTVEPMLTAGVATHHMWDDRWTVATDDGLPSAQFEHTVIVTDTGVEILTIPPAPVH